MKKKIAVILIVIFCIALTWFLLPTRAENYTRTHRDFLHYSLGNYEVERVQSRTVDGIRYTVWHIHYQRQTGEDTVLVLNNQFPFEHLLMLHAERWASDTLTEEFTNRYFPSETLDILGASIWSREFFSGRHSPPPHLSDPQNGLRLRYMTPQELVSDWEFIFEIEAGASDQEMIEVFKAMTRSLATYLGQNYINVSFYITNRHGSSFWGQYNKQTDIFEAGTRAER